MNLTERSVRNPTFAWMLTLGIVFLGIISIRRLGIGLLPDTESPYIGVTLLYDGAAPEGMETQVAEPIENALLSLPGIKSVDTSVRMGVADLQIELEAGRNVDSALADVQARVLQTSNLLPRQLSAPIIQKSNPNDLPFLSYALNGENTHPRDLMIFLRDRIVGKLSSVPGVAKVELGGYAEPVIQVQLSGQKLAAYELTPQDILTSIRDGNLELPGGRIEQDSSQVGVRTLGIPRTIEEFRAITINRRGDAPNFNPVRLDQIASVEEGLADVRRVSRFNGRQSISLSIVKQRGANVVEVARALDRKVEEIRKDLPAGMKFERNFDTTDFVEDSIRELVLTLVFSILITSALCWLFLRSWRPTLNVLLAIPTSILGSFFVIKQLGYTLNSFTGLALCLAAGIVVDDAIIVLENITRHREMGKNPIDAALDGTREISSAALGATLAIVAIFLPFFFLKGPITELLVQFGVTLSVTVLISYLEAITLTPMRCSLKEGSDSRRVSARETQDFFSRLASSYRSSLGRALRFPGLILFGALALSLLALIPAASLNLELMPRQDQGMFAISVSAETNDSLHATDRKMLEIEKTLGNIPEIERCNTVVGGLDGSNPHTGDILITLKPRSLRKRSQYEIMDECRERMKSVTGVIAYVSDIPVTSIQTAGGAPIDFNIEGPDLDKLGQLSELFKTELDRQEWAVDTYADPPDSSPEVLIIPNRSEAARRGITVRDISETVNTLISGTSAGKFARDGRNYDIRVKLEPEGDRIQQMLGLQLRNNLGQSVTLWDVTSAWKGKSASEITRHNRARKREVAAGLKKGHSLSKAIHSVEEIAKRILPPGYSIEFTGQSAAFQESIEEMILALLLGVLISYMVLTSQFNSLTDPLLVLLALPLSLVGAFLALKCFGQTLNLYSLIGLVLLMGIAKKNSILLVEFTNQVHKQASSVYREALLTACPQRLRPILMTSMATIVGALPAVWPNGPGYETRVPMGVTIIGGTLLSTVFTLFVVPSAYLFFKAPAQEGRFKSFFSMVRRNPQYRPNSVELDRVLVTGLVAIDVEGATEILRALPRMESSDLQKPVS